MIEKLSRVDKIEIGRDDTVSIQIAKEIVEDGKVLFSEPHRTTIAPQTSVEDQMVIVNNHLVAMGYAPVPTADVDRIALYARANR